jgi:hypothetical protein
MKVERDAKVLRIDIDVLSICRCENYEEIRVVRQYREKKI